MQGTRLATLESWKLTKLTNPYVLTLNYFIAKYITMEQ